MLDFTLKILMELYQGLQSNNYTITPLYDFLKKDTSGKICILRHDIDRGLGNALRLAEVEKKMGIQAAYYFRYPKTFNEEIIKKIYNFGHEIGYHYEVLETAKGNYTKAAGLFKEHLREFKKIVPLYTICAHGSPFSRWDNKALWEHYKFADFGITGEAYLSFDFNEILYLTDTGRGWNKSAVNRRDKVNTKLAYEFRTTREVISALKAGALPHKIMLNIHPNRWNDNLLQWGAELVGQTIKNAGKAMIVKVSSDG